MLHNALENTSIGASSSELQGLQCGVCRQAFSGRAAALLTERLQKHVEQQQDVQTGPSMDLLKQQVTTATGLWQQGKLQEAANLFRETITGLKMTDAKGQLYSAQHNLSLVMVAMGRPEEARAELRIARRGLATLYGAQHPLALKAAHNEAMAANAAGHREEALKLYEVALEARCRVLGSHHVDTLKTRCNYGLTLRNCSRTEEAEIELRLALAGLELVVGPRHPLSVTALQNLSLALSSRGQLGDAAAAQAAALVAREAAEGKHQLLGASHPEALEARRDLGATLFAASRQEEGVAAFRQALAGLQQTLGFQHPTTIAVLAQLRAALSHDEEAAMALVHEHSSGNVTAAPDWEVPQWGGKLVLVLVAIAAEPGEINGSILLVDHLKRVATEARAEALFALSPWVPTEVLLSGAE
ncbi:unnamed protein product, partial [Symbiodinium sp. CCMP2456]